MARHTGVFKETSAIELGACAAREGIQRAGAGSVEFDHVVFGHVLRKLERMDCIERNEVFAAQ